MKGEVKAVLDEYDFSIMKNVRKNPYAEQLKRQAIIIINGKVRTDLFEEESETEDASTAGD